VSFGGKAAMKSGFDHAASFTSISCLVPTILAARSSAIAAREADAEIGLQDDSRRARSKKASFAARKV
jgi:hypothetical protein